MRYSMITGKPFPWWKKIRCLILSHAWEPGVIGDWDDNELTKISPGDPIFTNWSNAIVCLRCGEDKEKEEN